MKKHLLILVFFIALLGANAQNVGIGTTSPNASALLDLNSTTRGFLLPRMNTTQMFAIQNPASGLMVFNSTYNELYHYNGTSWRSILNGNYWSRPISSRDILSNITDSLGIGISIPTKLMDVNGTMRVRGTFTADGVIDASTLFLSDNFMSPSGIFTTTLQSNNEILINSANGILQLKDGADNKGFVQLSGDDLRIGTNSSNTEGKLVMRVAGADRVKVDVNGMNVNGMITSPNTGPVSLVPLCWGVTLNLNNPITVRGTYNVSVQRVALGHFRVFCPGITELTCAVFSPGATGICIGHFCSDGYIDVYVRKSDTQESFDQAFSFVIY